MLAGRPVTAHRAGAAFGAFVTGTLPAASAALVYRVRSRQALVRGSGVAYDERRSPRVGRHASPRRLRRSRIAARTNHATRFAGATAKHSERRCCRRQTT
jgi:hypothetical protein